MNAAKFQPPGEYSATLKSPPPLKEESDEINLGDYLGVLLDHKWLIAVTTALVVVSGVAYSLLAAPIYEANLLIQVEDSNGTGTSVLGEAANLFDVKTPAVGEIEILRSRMVIGQAVENTKLYIEAQPLYIPLIGNWLARRADTLSDPGIWGLTSKLPLIGKWLGGPEAAMPRGFLAGYVSGTERIVVPDMEVFGVLRQAPFTLTTGNGGEFTLEHDELDAPLRGKQGSLLIYEGAKGRLRLLVAELDGRPGAQFTLSRSSRLATVESLQRRLQLTEKGRQSGVINATLQDDDPKRLVVILNEVGHQYVRQNVERKAAEAQKTLGFLGEQLPQYKKQQEDAEKIYNRYRNQKGTVAFDEEAKLVLGQTVDLQTKLLDAKQRRRELESRFTMSHPSIQTVDGQIAQWNREIDALNARVKSMPQIQQEALRMERDVRVNAEMYQSLLNSSLQLSLVKEGKVGNVRLLDEAVLPEVPVRPQKSTVIAISVLLGLVLGVSLAAVRNSLLRGIRHSQQIEAQTGLNVYSTIPMSPDQSELARRVAMRKPGIHLLAVNSPGDLAIESLRSLRTALQFAMLEASNNRVIITGPTPGVGKTFVSVNFAAILAAGGKRVLLIDADMRKGHINQYLGLKREQGLSELIAGSLDATEVIHPQVLPCLDVITTGLLPPNPAELVMSDSFVHLLNELSGNYDLVIVDTPPVLMVADTAAIASHAGTLLLVARAEQSQIAELQEAAKRLSNSGKGINGVLFNGMDLTRSHYGTYGYKYGGYRYMHDSYKAAA
jgi:tyrosine-protein kinase Etk/Wzc